MTENDPPAFREEPLRRRRGRQPSVLPWGATEQREQSRQIKNLSSWIEELRSILTSKPQSSRVDALLGKIADLSDEVADVRELAADKKGWSEQVDSKLKLLPSKIQELADECKTLN